MNYDEVVSELYAERGIDPEVAAAAGVKRDGDQLTYPNGRARNLGDGPKMVQPPGHALSLWWLDADSPEDRDVLVCEGETDALAALSSFENVDAMPPFPAPLVAAMPGASYPAERLAEELMLANRVYLCLDNDEAGEKAAERLGRALLDAGVAVSLVQLPEQFKDLAEYLAQADPGWVYELLVEAEPFNLPEESNVGNVEVKTKRLASVMPGDQFILADTDRKGEALWGAGSQILWIAGEPLLICASPGIGKTTIAQQIALGMIGVAPPELLGYPVKQIEDRVLYIAADRPRQAQRSFRRMVTEGHAQTLSERLSVLRGPCALSELVEQAQAVEAGVIFVDSLAAIAPGDLSQDDTGMKVYHAMQAVVRAGIELCVLHHNRKRGGADSGWRGLDEVYGSRWITAAPGSVLYIAGKQGDTEASLRHLKMPAAPVGPMKIYHDHAKGRTYSDKLMGGPSREEREARHHELKPADLPGHDPQSGHAKTNGSGHAPTDAQQGELAALGVSAFDDD